MRIPFLPLCCVALAACAHDQPATTPLGSAQSIVEKAIIAHGGRHLHSSKVEFDFRGRHFVLTRREGLFSYERTYVDGSDHVREVLSNNGLVREINDEEVELTQESRRSLLTQINSVPYFALLPFNLGDPAVKKAYLGRSVIGSQPYHEIEVTFEEDGGGDDFEDRYVYWFHEEHHTMDFLAYTFRVGDGGTRFREAFNVRTVGGVRFADYHNYVSDELPGPDAPIERYDDVFQAGGVELLSEIILDQVSVTPLTSE